MSRFWSSVVSTLDPYVPGEQPRLDNLVKLNTNEMPYGPSPKVIQAIADANNESLRLYPDPSSTALRQAIAKRFGLSADQVFVGNGSDEVLAHVFVGLLKQSRPLWFPEITYSFYPVYCGLFGMAYRQIPLDSQFQVQPGDYCADASGGPGAIIIANPNAPTGHALDLSQIEAVLKANPDIPVVIDEAYVDFGAQTASGLINHYPNLLVVHTMSKSRSLAGMRVGFAMGQADLIEGLDRVKNSFNSYPLDRLAQAGATAAIEDENYFEQTRQRVISSRVTLTRDLEFLGFEVLPSQANFVFARHPQKEGAFLAQALRQRNIIVRHFAKPRISEFLRITIGTDPQCKQLVNALRDILGA